MEQIRIDNEILYVEGLENFGPDHYQDNGIRDFINVDTLKSALCPIAKVGKVIKQGFKELSPDELELTLQLQIGISGDELAFAVVNAEAQAHLSVRFLWKLNEDNHD